MSTFSADQMKTDDKPEAPVDEIKPVEEETETKQDDEDPAQETEDDEEKPVAEVTDPETQADTAVAEEAKEKIVPGAVEGPDVAGVVRNEAGRVAYAPPGTMNAALNGVQEDAAGHVGSTGTDNSSASGTRI